MGVDVVISVVAVLAFADQVGKLPQREQIGLFFKKDAVVKRKARFSAKTWSRMVSREMVMADYLWRRAARQ